MVVQPIVDIRSGEVHAFEALARFGEAAGHDARCTGSPSPSELGGRPALERACLREALELLAAPPARDAACRSTSRRRCSRKRETGRMLEEAAGGGPAGLRGLIVEITEETLIAAKCELQAAIESLLAHGAALPSTTWAPATRVCARSPP